MSNNKRVDKTGWKRCRVCGKKSPKSIFLKGLPFIICPNCGAVFVRQELLKEVKEQAESPILTPKQGNIILPGVK
jgi:hypothetical protein